MKSMIRHCTPNQEYNKINALKMAKRMCVNGKETQCEITDFIDHTDQWAVG